MAMSQRVSSQEVISGFRIYEISKDEYGKLCKDLEIGIVFEQYGEDLIDKELWALSLGSV